MKCSQERKKDREREYKEKEERVNERKIISKL